MGILLNEEKMVITLPLIVSQLALLSTWTVLWLLWPRLHYFFRFFLLLISLFFGVACLKNAYREYYPTTAVSGESVSLYVGPDSSYPIRAQLHDHEEVVVEQMKDGWYYVATAHGRGWIHGAQTVLGKKDDTK